MNSDVLHNPIDQTFGAGVIGIQFEIQTQIMAEQLRAMYLMRSAQGAVE
jgi:hypothetical protein